MTESRNDIYITKPDNGSSRIILDSQDYIDKMAITLNDSSMFKKIGPTSTCDNTSKIEVRTQIIKKKNDGVGFYHYQDEMTLVLY